MAEVRWTLHALDDVENIAKYTEQYAQSYAVILVRSFFDSLMQIERFPKSGRIVPEFQNSNLRELIIHDYRMVYLIKSDELVEIITVHPSKKPMQLKV